MSQDMKIFGVTPQLFTTVHNPNTNTAIANLSLCLECVPRLPFHLNSSVQHTLSSMPNVVGHCSAGILTQKDEVDVEEGNVDGNTAGCAEGSAE